MLPMSRSRSNRFRGSVVGGLLLAALAGTPVSAQTLTYSQGADFDVLDPAVSGSSPTHILFRHLFNGLVRWSDNSMSQIVGDLATEWQMSPDGLEWSFKLRDGVKFHDGEPFNAEAVKFNIERLTVKETGSPVRSLFAPVKAVTVVDPLTVKLQLASPIPSLLELLADEYGLMSSPKAVMEKGKDYAVSPVGTGPYVFQEWVPNDFARITRNPDYYGKPGVPEEIVFRPVPENAARVIEVESGNAQIATGIPPELAEQLKQRDDTRLIIEPSSFQIFFEFNTTAEPFKDVRMRQAVTFAVDRKSIVDQILGGYGTVPTSPFPPGLPGRVEFEPHAYDPARAKALVAEVYPNGYPGTVVMWTSSGRYTKDRTAAEAVQAYLNAIGLRTELKVWEWASYQREINKAVEGGTGRGSNAASMWLLGTGVPNPDLRLRRKLAVGDPSNLTGYNNAKVQELLAAAATELDNNARLAIYGEIQKIVWNEDPNYMPLFDQQQVLAVRNDVTDPVVFRDEIVLVDQVGPRQ